MEQLSIMLTERMVRNGIIVDEDKPGYCYAVQLVIEKVIGLSLILVFALCLHKLVQIAAFLSIFVLIRRSSDGVHCKTAIGCFCASVLLCLSTIMVAPIITAYPIASQCVLVVAVFILLMIATADNCHLNLTEREREILKKRSRITVLVSGILLMALTSVFPEFELLSYMALGVIYNALSLIMAKIEGRRNQSDDYEEI